MRYLPFNRGLALGLLALFFTAAGAQETNYSGIGSTPSRAQIEAWDIAVGPDGDELPPGQGTAAEGEPIYFEKCASCHGPNLQGRRDIRVGRLAGGVDTINSDKYVKSFGSYNPYATTLWDYINRAMPRFKELSLTPDEVYALSAYILHKSGIVGRNEVMNAETLPEVKMPNRDNYVPRRLEDIADIEERGCRNGRCP